MADQSSDASVSTFVSSVIFTVAVSAVLFLVYTIVRSRYPRVYAPKTYMGPSRERPEEGSEKGFLGWIFGSRKLNDLEVIERCGLDAYMFLEFLNKAFFLFLGFAILAIPILIPLNASQQLALVGLNQFTIANVLDQKRLWGHVLLAALFCGVTMAGCYIATRRYIDRRQQYLTSDFHSQSMQANTILVTGLPKGQDNLSSLSQIFDHFPGGVNRIWMAYAAKDLQKDCSKRIALINKLETAECALIKSKLKLSADRSAGGPGRRDSEVSHGSSNLLRQQQEQGGGGQTTSGSVGDESFPPEKRPKHRPATFPMTLFASCCGAEKVDSITTYRSELSNMNSSILAKQQAGLGVMHSEHDQDKMSSAFVQFNNQMGAHAAVQAIDQKLTPTREQGHLEVHPRDVIWENLALTKSSRLGRKVLATLLATALIVFWAIPVTFVASVAKLDAIVRFAPFLSGVYKLPKVALGIIQGLLPPIGLAVLMMVLPLILYKLAHLGGAVLNPEKTLQVITSFHWFSVIHVLLVTTLANGIFAAVQQIKDDPSHVMAMLASTLPQASTFFLSFILLSLIQVPMMLLQIGPLIMYHVGKFRSSTPRQMYATERTMGAVDWGTTIPVHTIAFAIGLIYSTVQPLILPFMVMYFGLYYLAFRHMFLYVYRQPFDTGGSIFPRIIDQVYVAVIIFELVMLGLFVLQKAIGQAVIMFLCLVASAATIAYCRHWRFKSLAKYIPSSVFQDRGLDMAANGSAPNSASNSSRAPVSGGVRPSGSSRSIGSFGGPGDSTAEAGVPLTVPINSDPSDPGNYRASTTAAAPINPIPAQESFHEKSPYKDPVSPIQDPETSKEIYSPKPGARSPVAALPSPAQASFSIHEGKLDSPRVGQAQPPNRTGSTRSTVSTDSPIPSIRVENTTQRDDGTTPLGRQSSTSFSPSTEKHQQQHQQQQQQQQHPHKQRRPSAGLLQPLFTGHGGNTSTGTTITTSASLQVLGANHSICSSNNPAAETMVPDEYAYVNPGLWTQPQPIWLPKDPRGFAELETMELSDNGLSSTTDSATMDQKGRVAVEVSQREVSPGDIYWE